MPELSHDTAEDGFHEIQLSGKQLVFLFIVTTSVLVAVFLCGVLVGRGARAASGEEPEAVAAAGTAPAPQPVADGGPPASGPPASGPPAAEPPAPAAETPDELSYHKRLQGAGAAPETIKPQAETAPAPPPAEPPPPAARPTAPPAADVTAAGRPGTWVVQVIATRDPSVATAVVKQLADKGYPAFLVNPAAGAAQPFYKVHVGRYNDRREAEQVSSRIKKEEQFQPWISR